MSQSNHRDSSTRYYINTNHNASLSSISSLSSIDPSRYTINLENNGKLLRPKSDHNHEYRNVFNKYGASICCSVLPNTRTIPYYNFESTHYIYFQYKRHKLKRNNRNKQSYFPNDYQTQKRFSYYLLHLTYKQLLAIDKLIKQNNINNKLFTEGYPECLSDTKRKRTEHLDSQYSYEEWLITKPLLPNGRPNKSIFGKKKSMTFADLKQYSNYLHKVLNNIQLLLNDTLYEILNINDKEIITLFKTLAITKLDTLKSEANKYDHVRCLRDPTKLKRKIGIQFHTLWMVKRPLNDKNAAFLGCDHWALKFEGNDQLMTIGFFAFNKEHGIILTKIVPNTPLNRRLFWYYWPRDNIQQIESEHFNTRWTVLERLYLGEISCELIGILIEEWLSYDNHAIYDLTHNNCQHFVRDFVAPLNIKIAKRLSSSFDVKVVKSLIPAGVLAEGIDAEAKCNNIHKRLWPVLSEYQNNIKKKNQNDMNEQQLFEQNFDFIAHELGISSNDNNYNEIKEEEEEITDTQDSLTIYKTHIDINAHGNECMDDDDDDDEYFINNNNNNSSDNNKLDIHKMNLTVTPSFSSVENKSNDKDNKHNDVK